MAVRMGQTINRKSKFPKGIIRECVDCGLKKPREEFPPGGLSPKGFPSYRMRCQPCQTKSIKQYQTERDLRMKYGLTLKDYDEMASSQKGLCKICGRPPDKSRLVVDHNHKTGEVRGLLCNRCNLALGFVEDSPDYLGKMIQYLLEHKCQ